MKRISTFCLATVLLAAAAHADEVDAVFADTRALYVELHQSPELSSHEAETAAKLAQRLRALGYAVTEHVGGTGIVALLRNGAGPTVMLRTELDALPVDEKTGVSYASRVHARDDAGRDVGVMHACGHDLHMAALVGTAAVMARDTKRWHGTLMLVGQPAEETISGARRMLDDGLFKRFPKPDHAVALHVYNDLPAGKVGVGGGYRQANADSLRVTIFGKGGHGSRPESTIDPVVIAAKVILALQTIVAREVKPGEPAVVTVGYVHAGAKNNIISDRAELGLTVRTYKPEVRKQILAAIPRIARGEALAAGAPKEPTVERYESTDAVYNDPPLSAQLRAALEAALGKGRVEETPPVMGSEDFSAFVQAGVPSCYINLGAANPAQFARAKATGEALPSNHSPLFAPDVDPTLRTGIGAELAMLLALLR